ncbi:hypothetical protein [Actibacterium sp. XHP0104]|nr:hypothetical protein [Actibacterium sp. XHP0104]MCV2880859.1 hypothetical protein [Actibacterium sp. XHP0104]
MMAMIPAMAALVSGLSAVTLFDIAQRRKQRDALSLAVLAAGAMLVLLAL